MKKLRLFGASLVLVALTVVPFGTAGAQESAPAGSDEITVARAAVCGGLQGRFRARVRLTGGTDQGQDRRFRERIRFNPRSRSASVSCTRGDSDVPERVRFRIKGGGNFLRMVINRQREGVYKGRDRDRVRCDTADGSNGNQRGTLRERLRVKIVEANNDDEATRVRGRVRLRLNGCGDDEDFKQRARFRANRRGNNN